jgi:regulator of cell morphogenesis and NO signaling
MSITMETTVGQLAAEKPLATRVFARHGIDFCCGGGKPLGEVCAEKGLQIEQILAEIDKETQGAGDSDVRWDQAPLPEIIDHILNTFHKPLYEELPRLEAMAQKVAEVHGDKDSRLAEIQKVVVGLKAEMFDHMAKEEQILFPMINRGMGAMAGGPVSVMLHEHDSAGNALARLRELTDGYVPSEQACNTWRALWAGLAALETATHQHIHIENNILFPRALAG